MPSQTENNKLLAETEKEMARRGMDLQPQKEEQPVNTSYQSGGDYNAELTDVNAEIARRESQRAQQEQQMAPNLEPPVANKRRNPVVADLTDTISTLGHGAANLLQGTLEGHRKMMNYPYQMARQFSPETAKRWEKGEGVAGALLKPDNKPWSVPGSRNPGALGKFTQDMMSYAVPGTLGAALTGGAINPITSGIVGGALSGGSNADNSLLGTTIGAAAGPVLKGGMKMIDLVRKSRPAKYAAQIAERGTRKFVEKVGEKSKGIYKKLAKDTAGESIVKDAPLTRPDKKMHNLYRKDQDLNDLYKAFRKTEGYSEAKELRTQIGKEVARYGEKAKVPGGLEPKDRAKIKILAEEGKRVKAYITNHFSKNPQQKKLYEQANILHRKDVIPARNAQSIIENLVDEGGNVINQQDLIKAISKASSVGALRRKPMPKDLIELNKIYKMNLNNKQLLTKVAKWAALLGLPTTLLGHKGFHVAKSIINPYSTE